MLGPSSETIELWRWFWLAGCAGLILLVVIGLLFWWRPGPRKKAWLVFLVPLTIGSWVGHRITTEERRHITSLADEAAALFDGDVRKGPLQGQPPCGDALFQSASVTNIVLADGTTIPNYSGLTGAAFETIENVARGLEDNGWTVTRYMLTGQTFPDDARINAKRGSDYAEIIFTGYASITTYTDPCFAEKWSFDVENSSITPLVEDFTN